MYELSIIDLRRKQHTSLLTTVRSPDLAYCINFVWLFDMGRSTLALYLRKKSKKHHLSSSEGGDAEPSMAKNIEDTHSEKKNTGNH